MTPERAPGRMRILVLAAHIAALLGGLAFAWREGADIAAQQAAIEQTRQTFAQLDARLAAAGGPHPALASKPTLDPFLPGASAALAGANLQDRVVSTIRRSGGTVTSSQVDTSGSGPAGAGAMPPAIQLTVNCEIGNAALQALLYALETEAPALFIDQITIESEGRGAGVGTGGDALKIGMVVSAFWTGDGRS